MEAVYFALWHEWVLYHGRLRIVAFGRSLGWTVDDMLEAGYTFTTPEGRRAIAHVVRESMGPDGQNDAENRGQRDGGIRRHGVFPRPVRLRIRSS